MKVWVVDHASWEWHYIKGVFDSREKAEEWVARQPPLGPIDGDYDIEEHVLNEPEPDDA